MLQLGQLSRGRHFPSRGDCSAVPFSSRSRTAHSCCRVTTASGRTLSLRAGIFSDSYSCDEARKSADTRALTRTSDLLLELDVLRRQTTQTAIALALRTERKRVFRVFPCTQACASDSLANVRATSQQTFAPHTWTALSLQVSDSILRRSLRRHAFVVLQ